MPFRSKSQRKWMYATHPQMAKKWEAHTPKGKDLPEHVKQAEPPPPKGVSSKEWDKILQGLPKKTKTAYYSAGMKLALWQLGLLQGETP